MGTSALVFPTVKVHSVGQDSLPMLLKLPTTMQVVTTITSSILNAVCKETSLFLCLFRGYPILHIRKALPFFLPYQHYITEKTRKTRKNDAFSLHAKDSLLC